MLPTSLPRLVCCSLCPSPALADPLSGAALYADVQRYDSFGSHRYGSPGAERALAWIAEELERAGLKVSSQRFSLRAPVRVRRRRR